MAAPDIIDVLHQFVGNREELRKPGTRKCRGTELAYCDYTARGAVEPAPVPKFDVWRYLDAIFR